jgi:hypothetical protein
MVHIVWNCSILYPIDIEKLEVQSGAIILGSRIDPGRDVPGWVCLTCQPRWSEVHKLAIQDCELQISKENAIDSQDFDRARQMRDL